MKADIFRGLTAAAVAAVRRRLLQPDTLHHRLTTRVSSLTMADTIC